MYVIERLTKGGKVNPPRSRGFIGQVKMSIDMGHAKKFGTVADAACYLADKFGEFPNRKYRVVEVPNSEPPPRTY